MDDDIVRIVLNRRFGGFRVPDTVASYLGCEKFDSDLFIRTNPFFIDYVRTHQDLDLQVFEFPSNNTDYEIFDYDGFESLIYIVDGKIHYATKENFV